MVFVPLCGHILLNIKRIFLVVILKIRIVVVFLNVEFVGKERAYSAQLQNSFTAVHYSDLVL